MTKIEMSCAQEGESTMTTQTVLLKPQFKDDRIVIRLRDVIKKYSVPLFILLAFGWSWGRWLSMPKTLDTYQAELHGAESILSVSTIPIYVRIGFALVKWRIIPVKVNGASWQDGFVSAHRIWVGSSLRWSLPVRTFLRVGIRNQKLIS